MNEHVDRRLYAAWRAPDGLIHPIGLLTRHHSVETDSGVLYRFVYLKAAERLEAFLLLPGLPDLYREYESEILFPVFRIRQMSRRRPDYSEFVRELDLDVDADPFEVMARSHGWRATDRYEVFAHPNRAPDGNLTTVFFARGIRHLEGAAEAVANVQPGDGLRLENEPDNLVNPRAILMCNRTGEPVGWVPNYIVDMIHELRDPFGTEVSITAEHINAASTSPPHMRLLCRLRAPWPDGYEPLSAPEFQPIVS